MIRDNYITLYNIFRDKNGENENFNRTILYVHLEETRGAQESAVGGGTAVTSTDGITLFIPFCVEGEANKKFIDPESYKKLDDKSGFFTFTKGDIVMMGQVNEEITSEKEFVLSHPQAVRVSTYEMNNFGSYALRHWEVHCN